MAPGRGSLRWRMNGTTDMELADHCQNGTRLLFGEYLAEMMMGALELSLAEAAGCGDFHLLVRTQNLSFTTDIDVSKRVWDRYNNGLTAHVCCGTLRFCVATH